MKRIIIYILIFIIMISIFGISSFYIAKNRANDIALTFKGPLSPLKGELVLFGDDPIFPCWVFSGEYSNAITGAKFDVYVSFLGKVLKQPNRT
jgi:hypothetical protein